MCVILLCFQKVSLILAKSILQSLHWIKTSSSTSISPTASPARKGETGSLLARIAIPESVVRPLKSVTTSALLRYYLSMHERQSYLITTLLYSLTSEAPRIFMVPHIRLGCIKLCRNQLEDQYFQKRSRWVPSRLCPGIIAVGNVLSSFLFLGQLTNKKGITKNN